MPLHQLLAPSLPTATPLTRQAPFWSCTGARNGGWTKQCLPFKEVGCLVAILLLLEQPAAWGICPPPGKTAGLPLDGEEACGRERGGGASNIPPIYSSPLSLLCSTPYFFSNPEMREAEATQGQVQAAFDMLPLSPRDLGLSGHVYVQPVSSKGCRPILWGDFQLPRPLTDCLVPNCEVQSLIRFHMQLNTVFVTQNLEASKQDAALPEINTSKSLS